MMNLYFPHRNEEFKKSLRNNVEQRLNHILREQYGLIFQDELSKLSDAKNRYAGNEKDAALNIGSPQ